MHKQAGYQFAPQGLHGFVEDEMTGFVAILHGNIVAERQGARLILMHSGFRTPSTARAMNGAMEDGGVKGIRIILNQESGELVCIDSRFGQQEIPDEGLLVTLDKGNFPLR